MPRIDLLSSCVLASALAACASDDGGSGSASASSHAATTAASVGSGAATSSSSAQGGSGGHGGEAVGAGGAGGQGGGGGQGGDALPTPAECWAIHDEDECLAAGCGGVLTDIEAVTIVDGVCETALVDVCVRSALFSGFSRVAVWDVQGDGPDVLRFRNSPDEEEFPTCDDENAPSHLGCCCGGATAMSDYSICEGITPLPPE